MESKAVIFWAVILILGSALLYQSIRLQSSIPVEGCSYIVRTANPDNERLFNPPTGFKELEENRLLVFSWANQTICNEIKRTCHTNLQFGFYCKLVGNSCECENGPIIEANKL